MKFILHINPKTIVESHTAPLAPKILDEIDALADNIQANMGKEVNVPKDVLDSFKIKDSLNQDIWPNDQLNPKDRTKLIQVANDFYKDLNLPRFTRQLQLVEVFRY
jgi:Cdc6-like AAA superfamily ATPase